MRLSDCAVEPPKRLSESALWRLQAEAYDAHGPQAWGGHHVPFQAVANPHFADACAEVVVAWLAGAPADAVVDVLEVGAGSARFAHYLLRSLEQRLGASGLRRVRLVITDLAPSNVQAWREHPQLLPWFQAGVLDAVVFDAVGDLPLTLTDGSRWPSRTAAHPPLVIANYLFDSVPSDAFWREEGELFEQKVGLLRVSAEAGGVAGVTWVEERHLAVRPCYDEPLLEALLDEAAAELDRTCFLLPVAALRCLERLREAAGGQLWVLANDKGDPDWESQRGREGIQLTRHGPMVSAMVNFAVLARYAARREGGVDLDRGEPRLVSALIWLGVSEREREPVRRAHAHAFGELSALDLGRLLTWLETVQPTPSMALGVVRLCRHDPFVLVRLREAFMRDPAALRELVSAGLEETLTRVWEARFELAESVDALAFDLGSILHRAGCAEAAVRQYARVRVGGPTGLAASYNLAVALDGLGRREEAREAAATALTLAPDREDVRALWRDLGGA